MYCPNCGTPNAREAQTCVNCKAPLPKLSPTGELVIAQSDVTVPAQAGPETARVNPTPPPAVGYGFNSPPPVPGPYSPPGYTPYYNYSLPIDRVGVAAVEPGLGTRLGAWFIDSLILSTVTSIVFFVPMIAWLVALFARYPDQLLALCSSSEDTYDQTRCTEAVLDILNRPGEGSTFGLLLLSMLLVCLLLVTLYYTLSTTWWGGTVGKKAFGLKVVKKDGAKIGFGRSLLRHTVGYWISGAVFFMGFIWIAFDPHKQGWHDKIAGTYVVRAR